MNTFINNLLLYDRLNEQQIKVISHLTQLVHLHVGEYYAEPGNILSQLAFVEKGVLRYSYYNSKAENITSSLVGEGNFLTAGGHLQLSFIQSDYIEAITSCTLFVIAKSGMEELSATITNWNSMTGRISQKAVAERRCRIIQPSANIKPEVVASQYLQKFPNVGKYLNVTQLLQYLNAQFSNQQTI
jgi:CRP-like cAMP-binding protein